MAVKLLLTAASVVLWFMFHFLSNTLGTIFLWSNSPTAVYSVSMSIRCRDELSTYNLCPTFSVLAVHMFTVASVAVIEGIAHLLVFRAVQLSYMWAYISYSHKSCNFLPNGLYFVGMCCLKMTLLLKSTIILNAGCSVSLILSLWITELVFSTISHIFHMSCRVDFCCHWSAEIWVYDRICLVIEFCNIYSASGKRTSVTFYYQLCYVQSIAF